METAKRTTILTLIDLGSIRSRTHGVLYGLESEAAFPPFDRQWI